MDVLRNSDQNVLGIWAQWGSHSVSNGNSGGNSAPTVSYYQVATVSDLHFNPFYDPSQYAQVLTIPESGWLALFLEFDRDHTDRACGRWRTLAKARGRLNRRRRRRRQSDRRFLIGVVQAPACRLPAGKLWSTNARSQYLSGIDSRNRSKPAPACARVQILLRDRIRSTRSSIITCRTTITKRQPALLSSSRSSVQTQRCSCKKIGR